MENDPYKYFRLEAHDLLTQLGTIVLALEKGGNSAGEVSHLLRLAHTLKGAARVVKLTDLADGAHAIEDALSPFRGSTAAIPQPSIDAALEQIDRMNGLLQALSAPHKPAARAEPAAAADGPFRTVRADIAEMDALLDGIAETRTVLNGLRTAPRAAEQAQHLAALLLAHLAQRPGREQPARGANGAHGTAEEIRRLMAGLKTSLDVSIGQMDRELNQLRDAAQQLRLVSAGALFAALERLARDVARGLGKQVAFEASGGDIHLDAYVLGAVQNALVQLIRNGVAHGIEAEQDRRAAGKPLAGRIALAVSRRGNQVVFRCEDDGRGVDLGAVRRVAERRGLIEPGTPPLSAEAVVGLLLGGGISTSDSITDASGRGVGLDVVRESIEQLGGTIAVHTAPGRGAVFELAVPLSVTSLHGLAVEASSATVIIPVDAVRTSLRVAAGDIARTPQGASILHDGKTIPFVSLARVLFGVRSSARAAWPVVVLSSGDSLAAVGVDRLLGTSRVVVRPLPDVVPAEPTAGGTALDADGNPQIILDPAALVAAAQRGFGDEIEPPAAKKPILVVDDSLTTRMLERSILEGAGYEVDMATSAEEGLEIAHRKAYALALVDVEMPGMDGFAFVEQARGDPSLHRLPIVLVTSRSSAEDLQRGRDAGANGYVTKGEFDQTRLLAMIKPLVDR